MSEQEEVYTKYPWVKAYEALAQKLRDAYNDLTQNQKDEGDYSPIVTKVKNAFRQAGVGYFRDEWLFKEKALKALGFRSKKKKELTKAEEKQVAEKINELKKDDRVKREIADKSSSDIDPFSIF